MNLNTALKEKDGFSENEARIADYILSHKDAVLQMPIQKLARETYTSTSAIMRLCAKLQTSGYRQFKILYAQQLAENTNDAVDPNFPFSRYDSTSEIATSLANLSTETLRAARNTLSLEDMHKACLAIHNARQTAIFGVGDAYHAQRRLCPVSVLFRYNKRNSKLCPGCPSQPCQTCLHHGQCQFSPGKTVPCGAGAAGKRK